MYELTPVEVFCAYEEIDECQLLGVYFMVKNDEDDDVEIVTKVEVEDYFMI